MSSNIHFTNQIPGGLPCGQFVYRAEGDQRILYADCNVVRLYGCDTIEEFIEYVGNSFRGMVYPEDLAEAERTINAQTIESGHRHDYLRYRILTKQGQIRYIEDFGHIIFDENGNAYYYVFIVEIDQEEYFNDYFNSFAEGQINAMNWKVDHTTGLRNMLAFQEDFSNAQDGAHDRSVIAVFDIIGLRRINHDHGRATGDRSIRSLVQAAQKHMPKNSSFYRGYDAEIIAVCPDTTEEEVTGRIRDVVSACPVMVFYGIAPAQNPLIHSGYPEKKGSLPQVLEEAYYDLNLRKMLSKDSARSEALTSLVRALEEVDHDTEEHVLRTRSMGLALGKRLGLSDAWLLTLDLMCLLHDIGKIAIPLEILNKPGKLTNAEWKVLRSHAEKGCQIASASRELSPIASYIRYHHERWDGKGYPDGLSGEEIPILSRIISIVDAYDAMVNDRCYRKALSTDYAIREIRDNAGTQFDPHMAAVFLELLNDNPSLALGQKTDAGAIRVFGNTTLLTADEGNTHPVLYSEYRLDVDDRIIEADSSFESITGYPPEEILGKMSQYDLVPPEDRNEYIVQVGNQFHKSNTAFLRHRIQRRDGSIIHVVCHGERMFNSATRSFMSTIQIYEIVSDAEKEHARRLEQFYEKVRSRGIIFTHIAQALARGITDLYYVNIETDELIEYHTDDESGVLTEARRGKDFFEGCERDAKLYVHPEDQEAFVTAMNRDFLSEALKTDRIFELDYRRIKDGRTFYVRMRVSRIESDRRFLVIAVSDIDELMKKRREEERIQEERIIYARLHALTGNFLCVYLVDPETNHYREFSATDNYAETFSQAKGGTDFFEKVRQEALLYTYPADIYHFLAAFTRENVLAEIKKSGIFTLGYRLIMEGRPVHIQMKAAMIEEKEGPRLIVGLNNIDVQVRQEEEYERRLAQAQNLANCDALTGVKNKHAYLDAEARMDRRITGHRQSPFAIVIFDVNDLKKVNDTAGHQAGDQYLRDACAIICETFKHSPVFRVGGDEFAVILQGKDYERRGELIGKMNDHNLAASRTGGIVIACGMAEYENDPYVASVFERADHRMYENKNALK